MFVFLRPVALYTSFQGEPLQEMLMRRYAMLVAVLPVLAWLGASALSQPLEKGGDKVLPKTPSQMEGPFYPDKLPIDTDNDLVIVNNSKTPAKGTVTHLSGKVLSADGKPVASALVEIWHVASRGEDNATADN